MRHRDLQGADPAQISRAESVAIQDRRRLHRPLGLRPAYRFTLRRRHRGGYTAAVGIAYVLEPLAARPIKEGRLSPLLKGCLSQFDGWRLCNPRRKSTPAAVLAVVEELVSAGSRSRNSRVVSVTQAGLHHPPLRNSFEVRPVLISRFRRRASAWLLPRPRPERGASRTSGRILG